MMSEEHQRRRLWERLTLPRRPLRRSQAFTRVDLTVVLAILAFAGPLFLICATKVKGASPQAQCIENYRQLTRAWLMYISEQELCLRPFASSFVLIHAMATQAFRAKGQQNMTSWFWYAVGAAVLYGAHQIFTKLAADRISDGLGGLVVEASAATTILLYLLWLRFAGTWNQTSSPAGVFWSVLTGICVGVGTVFFFMLFQKGGPLSAVPVILAGGAALMAIAGILFFKESASGIRLLGISLALIGLFLLRSP